LGEPGAYKLGFEAIHTHAIDDLIGGFRASMDYSCACGLGVGPFRVVMGPLKAVSERGSERPRVPLLPLQTRSKNIHFKVSTVVNYLYHQRLLEKIVNVDSKIRAKHSRI